MFRQIRKHGGNLEEASELYNIEKNNFIDFSANINPLGPPKALTKLIVENIDQIKYYPDSRNFMLKNAIANYLQISKEHLLMGNGASEIIFLITNYLKPQAVWIPVPAFSEYQIASEGAGAEIHHIPLQGEKMNQFSLSSLENMKKGDLLFLCNPNNPTGQLYEIAFLKNVINFVENKEAYLIIDESFLDFLENKNELSFMKKINENSNLLILYSLTKFFAIPGLRLGCLIANSELIRKVEKIKDPWNINVFAQIAGQYVVGEDSFIKDSLEFIQKEKKYLYNKLKEIKNIKPFAPAANFLFIEICNQLTSSEVCQALAKEGILIRNCNTYPLLEEKYIRVAVRSRFENDILISIFKNLFK